MSFLCIVAANGGAVAAPRRPPEPTVVELFTAQGCPACPAADAAMAVIARRSDVIALSLPVDYWNGRGRVDPLAQPIFTARQRRYAAVGRREAATPQFVINGRFATSDTEPVRLAWAIDAAARTGGPAVGQRRDRLTVGSDPRSAREAIVWLAEYDPRPIRTAVGATDAGGRSAVRYNVVRRLVAIGRWTGVARSYRLPVRVGPLRRAAIVQSADGGAIVAAAVIG